MWDVPENATKVKARLDFVFTGCRCKTGCGTNRCNCHKQRQICGPACKCISCKNLHSNIQSMCSTELIEIEQQELNVQRDISMVEDSDDEDDVDNETTTGNIMSYVFGLDSGSEGDSDADQD